MIAKHLFDIDPTRRNKLEPVPAATGRWQNLAVENEFGSPLLHPLLAGRWSPVAFDPAHEIAPDEIAVLLEAARWAPSAGNSQPWAFIVGQRGDATHERLVRHLAGSSARWAPAASLLVANLAHRYVADTDWEYSEFSLYDLGQAVAHLTLQAQALGLSARQFRAFSRTGVAAEFAVPGHWEVTTMMAIGRAARADAPSPAPARAGTPTRQRRSVEDILWPAD
jgi:nitroreductase